ncbi:MAG: hypothetical protein IKN11_08095 [Bacteroidales bacterium]|nr:hypothetical protein [Bacteroidales bacterium]
MKRLLIILFMCFLSQFALGQGTACITQSNLVGYPLFIRQYGEVPGQHLIYFTDLASSTKGYVGLTSLFSYGIYSQLVSDCTVKDIVVLGKMAYFCGQTTSNEALIGWFFLHDLAMGNGASPYIDMTFYYGSGLTSIDNIEVYANGGDTIVVGYGTDGDRNYAIKYNVSTHYYETLYLIYTPCDLTVTDNYIVYAGRDANNTQMMIHPFSKTGAFALTPPQYCTFFLGSFTAREPFGDLRIVHRTGDKVSTLSYRTESGDKWMMLREFSIFSSSPTMTAAYQIDFQNSAYNILDFKYSSTRNSYTILHTYEVISTELYSTVTKIDLSSGTPSSVPSHYIPNQDHVMRSLSLSDSSMYAVYGYETGSFENMFWKDYQYAIWPEPCLKCDELPFNTVTITNSTPVLPDAGSTGTGGVSLHTTYDPMLTPISIICNRIIKEKGVTK